MKTSVQQCLIPYKGRPRNEKGCYLSTKSGEMTDERTKTIDETPSIKPVLL